MRKQNKQTNKRYCHGQKKLIIEGIEDLSEKHVKKKKKNDLKKIHSSIRVYVRMHAYIYMYVCMHVCKSTYWYA